MSAFVCSDRHIATIACYFYADPAARQLLADNLARENVRSVNHRYRESTPFPSVALSEAAEGYSGSDIIRLLECLDYQSCEHPGYDQGVILGLVQQIIQKGDNLQVSRPNLWSI